ncbi:hypothetical protein O3G_MSEX008366 [Manduca sexta]|uniref:TRPA5-2 n=1 Tax=Manduca sexta TaxID=7130 RepID=A0A517BE59_MANSE|nr:hypothetical protein O3G_MSEX008366 [Manduca sexta]QDR51044.1 TRPA5-2 [Manduca sexta]
MAVTKRGVGSGRINPDLLANLGHELQSLTIEEDDRGAEKITSRPRSQSEAWLLPSIKVQQSQAWHGFDIQDSRTVGDSLPKLYRRSERFRRGLNTKLLEAIKCRDDLEVQRLLDQGANPNATCHRECISACHLAALAGGEALSLLHARHADMMRYDLLGRTPLHFAAWEGNIAQVALLLDMHKGLRDKIKHQISLDAIQEIKAINSHFQELANVRCKLGEITPKHLNAWQDTLDENTFRTEINFPLIKAGWTPLHAASANARPHCVRLLLAAGSDPNVRDFGGRSALDVAGFACYNGRQINPNNFAEVIKLLLKANPGNRSINQLKISHTPLHTAVEVGSIEGIAELLAVGASVSCLNQDGLTPLHLCVKKKQKDHLQIFLNKDVENASVVDKDGQTILHTAVRAKWVPGVCIALAAGAHPLAVAQYGETPFHLAAALGNVDIFSEIIEANGVRENINFKNAVHKTALFKAVEKGHTECVRKLLKYGASISETASQKMNVIHVAAKLGHADVLKLLLERSYTVTTDIINSRTAHDGKGFGPIHFAVWNNHPECVKLLLSKNACLILKTLCGPDKLSTPLHIAAMKNNLEIAKILLKFSTAIVHEVNNLGWTPLHTASHYKSRDVIFFLLKEGANLATITRGQTMLRKTAMEMIMNNLSKPTEFMEEVFDSCIHDNDLNLHEPQYQVTVDYSILITDTKDALSKTLPDYTLPINHNMGQMTVVDAIIGSGNRQKQNRLLLHPLIESFLCLKWRALLPFFCMIIIVYIAFVIALTGFVLSTFYDTDTEKSIPYTYDSGPWASITFAALSILVVQELFYYKFSRRYFGQFETWVKLSTIFLAIILMMYHDVRYLDKVWYRNVAALALLLSWVELMFLLSGFPNWGYYVPMFSQVSSKVVKILLTFGFLIIGFSLGFMIEFHAEGPFENPFAALVKTMVMMASEFDYDDLIDNIKEKKGLAPSLIPVRIIFLGFLIFTAIVLMNLMVGVAVNDLQNLEFLGNIRKTEKQVEFLAFLENIRKYLRLHRLLPACILKKFIVEKKITLCPSERSCKYYRKLPRHIRESIFEIAQEQKRHTDVEHDTKTYNTKLNEIYKAIVKRSKEEELSNTKVLIEEQQNGKQDMELIVAELKKQLDLHFERTIELFNIKTDSILNKLKGVGNEGIIEV